ncbi:MAG: tRNA uridine-5-carboxymethylaminomethyl(34) synthesis GTPase MnmE [Acidobacteriota bacterium]|nr:tRNA uridine-5-carboxymethylaminomethyl(34) synthesis GTPase MnmE [Acidobacteriota bacterium]
MDTIVALATPPGRSAIGVIRLSGQDALTLTRSVLAEDYLPKPGQTLLKNLRDPSTKELVDQALITFFQAPHSFTGEDVVEISCHGSPIILRHVVDLLLHEGARLAGPGEFTLRALAFGKMNLSQAEAIRDLINSQTDVAAQQALRQLSGELSARITPLKDQLVGLIVPLESALEFVEDDLPEVEIRRIKEVLLQVVRETSILAGSFSSGHLLRDGVKVTLVGRPNTGKSSLFNELLKTDRAIVTDLPGTTRDTLSEVMNIKGLPVLLTDTAGVRASSNRVESIGVERTRRAMADADLLLVVVDGAVDLTSEDLDFLQLTAGRRRVIALNKSDLPAFRDQLQGDDKQTSRVVTVSAINNEGLDELREAILEPFVSGSNSEGGLLITDARHYDLLCRAQAELEASSRAIDEGASEELVLVGLHNALRFLGEITGETTAEDVLSRIFSTFCIGK